MTDPQREAVAKFRKPEIIQKDDILDEFLDFLKYNSDASDEFAAEVKVRIAEFVGYKMDDVKAGEAEMLERWVKATQEVSF